MMQFNFFPQPFSSVTDFTSAYFISLLTDVLFSKLTSYLSCLFKRQGLFIHHLKISLEPLKNIIQFVLPHAQASISWPPPTSPA